MSNTARDRIISNVHFALIADIAFHYDPSLSLTKQMSIALGISETSCGRWLSPSGPPAPREIILTTLREAKKNYSVYGKIISDIEKATS